MFIIASEKELKKGDWYNINSNPFDAFAVVRKATREEYINQNEKLQNKNLNLDKYKYFYEVI